MAERTVADLENNVGGLLTGLDLNDVTDLFGCFERAVSTLIQRADVPEASGRQAFMLYDGVTDYAPGSTIFGNALVDLRPQGQNRLPWDTVEKTYIGRFDRLKQWKTPSGYLVTFEYRQGQQIMRVNSAKAQQRIIVDSMSATTGWSLGGTATSLLPDTTVYYQQPGALRFNLSASGSEGTLSRTLTSPLNLTAYQGVGVGFLAFDPPTTAIGHLTSIKLRLGSSASNYYEVDVTQGFTGAWYANEYQLVAFDLATASQTGTPVITAMQYVELLFDYDGTAMTNVRVGGLWLSLPSPHEMLFYSAAVFIPSNGQVPQTTISSVNDTIIFGDPAYNLFVREAARSVAQSQGGMMGEGVMAQLDSDLDGTPNNTDKPGLYAKFRGSNPSEELREVDNWYYN